MSKPLPLDDLAEFTRSEAQLVQSLGLVAREKPKEMPSVKCIDFIKAYSKAVSVKQSTYLETWVSVLN